MEWQLVKGDSRFPFFEQNPDLAYFPCIKNLINEKGEEQAGRIMWAIHMTEDINGVFYGLQEEEKRRLVDESFFEGKKKFEWDEPVIEKVIRRYPDITMPPKKRRYKRLQDSFDVMLKDLEAGEDKTLAIQRLQKVLSTAEDEWIEETNKMESSKGDKQENSFWNKQKN